MFPAIVLLIRLNHNVTSYTLLALSCQSVQHTRTNFNIVVYIKSYINRIVIPYNFFSI